MAISTSVIAYLAREEATHADDAQDVEDSWAHDGAHPHVTLGNENTWGGSHTCGAKLSQSTQMTVHYVTFTDAVQLLQRWQAQPSKRALVNNVAGLLIDATKKRKISSIWIIHCSILFRETITDCSVFECGSFILYIQINITFTFQH